MPSNKDKLMGYLGVTKLKTLSHEGGIGLRSGRHYPHFTKSRDTTPDHITDLRYIKDSGNEKYHIVERFHYYIDTHSYRHDSFNAIHKHTLQVFSVSATVGAGNHQLNTAEKYKFTNYKHTPVLPLVKLQSIAYAVKEDVTPQSTISKRTLNWILSGSGRIL